MRLIAWNCKGAFARKHPRIAALQPDVLVVPEAEKLGALGNVLGTAPLRSIEWVGENPKKGLAVLSYGDYSLEVHEAYDPRHRWILPVKVRGPSSFLLFAVWAVPHPESRVYVQCLFEALETYAALLESPRIVLAGDFNNNVVLDRPRARLKFSNWVATLERTGFRSLYHARHSCDHGSERDNTFFLHHNVEKGFHIDFVFATPDLYASGIEVSVGEHSDWFKSSDHMPVICSLRE